MTIFHEKVFIKKWWVLFIGYNYYLKQHQFHWKFCMQLYNIIYCVCSNIQNYSSSENQSGLISQVYISPGLFGYYVPVKGYLDWGALIIF